jgi:hypothetical protein
MPCDDASLVDIDLAALIEVFLIELVATIERTTMRRGVKKPGHL